MSSSILEPVGRLTTEPFSMALRAGNRYVFADVVGRGWLHEIRCQDLRHPPRLNGGSPANISADHTSA
jgi:hypothetical protein